jgi:hypothetical protein
MDSLLQACRDNFGATPRSFPRGERSYLYTRFPDWLGDDSLRVLQRDRDALLRRGRVVWAALIQANQTLFEPLLEDAPALVVWSENPEFLHNHQALRALGLELYGLKGENAAGDVAEVARLVTDEMGRPLNYRLPESLAKDAFVTTILVSRKQLPCGFLTSGLLPLLVLPEESPCSLILPGKFWPDELKDR